MDEWCVLFLLQELHNTSSLLLHQNRKENELKNKVSQFLKEQLQTI